jgi:hypothetical protein
MFSGSSDIYFGFFRDRGGCFRLEKGKTHQIWPGFLEEDSAVLKREKDQNLYSLFFLSEIEIKLAYGLQI